MDGSMYDARGSLEDGRRVLCLQYFVSQSSKRFHDNFLLEKDDSFTFNLGMRPSLSVYVLFSSWRFILVLRRARVHSNLLNS